LAGEIVHGNYFDKYRTRNPAARYLTRGFLQAWDGMLDSILRDGPVNRILEVGCGDGFLLTHTIKRLAPGRRAVGVDPGIDVLKHGITGPRGPDFVNGTIYALPFPDASFELVTVPEVFEHLDAPEEGLAEVLRVSSRYLLASVPWEPVWRVMNVLRGAYWMAFGNTPGHVNHFTRRGFIRFMEKKTDLRRIRKPFPWTMILAEKPRLHRPPSPAPSGNNVTSPEQDCHGGNQNASGNGEPSTGRRG